jgi:hypothetical protein
MVQKALIILASIYQLVALSYHNLMTRHSLHYSVHGFVGVTNSTNVNNREGPSQHCRRESSALVIQMIKVMIRILYV